MCRHRVLLCDLDGTLIVTASGKTFPENADDWMFKDGIKEAIIAYKPKCIFIVTNQGGIEKGFVDEKDFIRKMNLICDEMRSWGFIVDYEYCSTNDVNDKYRKPNTGMIDYFRHAYDMGYDFHRFEALMIGDASGLEGQFSDTDKRTAENARIRYEDVNHFIQRLTK